MRNPKSKFTCAVDSDRTWIRSTITAELTDSANLAFHAAADSGYPMNKPRTIDWYFDFISPFAYFAWQRLGEFRQHAVVAH